MVSVWLPWFNRRLAGGFAHLPSISGWRALGGRAGTVVLVAGVAGMAWALWRRRFSAAGLVGLGGVALLAEIAATVSRIGVEGPVTTTPTFGLALAFVGAAAAVLAGIASLLRA